MFPNRHRHTNFENKLTVIEREMDAARGNELGAWDEHTHPPPLYTEQTTNRAYCIAQGTLPNIL